MVGWLVGWLIGWLVGRSVGRLVGGSVGKSVIRCVSCIFCLFNLCSSENTARRLAGGLHLMCINKYILYVRCTLISKYLLETKITVARIIFESLGFPL